PLSSFIVVSNTGFVALVICSLFNYWLQFAISGSWYLHRIRFPQFSERRLQRPAARHDYRPFNEILQLANIAWPVPSRKSLHDNWRNGVNLLLHLLGKLLHKITHQLWNVFLTFPQRRYPDRKYMQAVVQITAEFAGRNHLFEIAIGRRYKPNIGSSCVSAPQSFKFELLQCPQQLRLNLNRNISHFVQKQSALIRQLHSADFLCNRAGESSFFMSKQFALQQ